MTSANVLAKNYFTMLTVWHSQKWYVGGMVGEKIKIMKAKSQFSSNFVIFLNTIQYSFCKCQMAGYAFVALLCLCILAL